MIYKRILIFCLLSWLAFKLSAQQSLIPPVNYYQEIATAETHYKNKGFAHALHAYEQALSTPNAKKEDYYNAACCASLVGDLDKAYTYLSKSIEMGYWDLKWMSNDADFTNFRQDIRWEKTIQKLNTTLNTIEAKFKPIENINRADLIPFQQNGLWGYLHRESKKILVPASFEKVGFAGDCLEIKYKNVLFSIDVQSKINLEYDNAPANRGPGVYKAVLYPKIDSSDEFKGFQVDKYGNVNKIAKDVDQDQGKAIFHPVEPISIDKQLYIIARKQGKYGLLRQDGTVHPKIGFNYKDISPINSYQGPEKCFLVETPDKKLSFIFSTGEVRLQNAIDTVFNDELVKFKFVKVRKGQREGLLDLTDLSWAIPLSEGLNIIDLGFTHRDWYCGISSSPYIDRSKISAFYFLVKNAQGKIYYMDKNQNIYLPKP